MNASRLPELIADWREHLAHGKAKKLTSGTRRNYAHGLERFVAWCRRHDRPLLEAASVRSWLEALLDAGYKSGSVNTWLAGVKSFFGWAVAEGRLAYNPAQGISSAPTAEAETMEQRLSLSDAEIARILAQPADDPIGKRDRAILTLMLYAAARTVDIERVSIGDVSSDPDGRLRVALPRRGESERPEHLLIAYAEAADALRAWLAVHPRAGDPTAALFVSLSNRAFGERLSGRAIRRLVKGYLEAAGISHPLKTTHSLRRTAISNALAHGVSLQRVRLMSRHRSLQSLSRYASEPSDGEPAESFIDYSGHHQE